MNIVSKEDVLHIAKLSKLQLTPTQQEAMQQSLNEVLTHIQALENIPTHTTECKNKTFGTLRADVVENSMPQQNILQNAPKQEGGAFAVPKVVE